MYQTLTLSKPTALSFPHFSGRVKIPAAQNRVRAVTSTGSPPRVNRRRSSDCLYEVLRVSYNATAIEIKTAYRSLAKIYHPDLSGSGRRQSDDGGDFLKIHNAYATLSDPVERKNYDSSIGVGIMESYRRRVSSFGFYPTRSWETDQCW